jgi:SAM-dependent methyltransferase
MRRKTLKYSKKDKHLISVESGSSNLEFMKYAFNYNNYLTNLLRRSLKVNDTILDFGAGTGEFALALTNLGLTVSVLEVEQTLAKNLQELGFQTFTSLDEVPNSSFSSIYSLNVLEHIEDDLEAIQLMSSKLEPGGSVILYLPAFETLFSEMDKRVGHYRRYDKTTLKQLLSNTDLEIEKMHYVDFLGFLVTLLYKITPKQDGSISIVAIRFFDKFIFPLNKIFDEIFMKYCGKNIFLIARKSRL